MAVTTSTPTVPDVAELIRRSQDTVSAVTDAYTAAIEQTIAAIPAFPTQAALPTTLPSASDAAAAVDGVYEYAHKTISIQRDFAKRLASIATV